MEVTADQAPVSQPDPAADVPNSALAAPPPPQPPQPPPPIITPNSATIALDPNSNSLNLNAASLRGSPSDRIIKPRPRKDSLQSISGSDSVPGRVQKPRARKSPGSGAKRSEPSKRKFICSFSHYGCDVALSSKNEWKRHVSIQHLQLGFYRCDVGSCNPDTNPNVAGSKRVYNDFNRKDLFTQHHRRMHKPDSGPGSGLSPIGNETNKDWRAFEDSLEEVRVRCWHERRKPPQRSTCGFCGRVFEGDGSWNERMEHVGGHFSRDIPEACKEEREDEDLTSWALKENIVKEAGNGRHALIDQPPTAAERPYMSRDHDVNMTDAPPMTPTQPNGNGMYDGDTEMDTGRRPSGAYQNGQGQLGSLRGAPLSPDSRRGYNVAPPPLRPFAFDGKEETSDRLEELVNTLLQPKPPKSIQRFSWKCDCNLELAVDLDSHDERAIASLGKLSIICKNASSPYLKSVSQNNHNVIACDEIAPYIRREGHDPIELHMPTIQETMEAPLHAANASAAANAHAHAQASANAAAVNVANAANAAMDATAQAQMKQNEQGNQA